MPIVKVEILKGKSNEYKKTVLDCVHEGLMAGLNISDWDRFQRLYELDRADFEFPSEKTENFLIIEITIFPSRTKEQKGKAISEITRLLGERLNIVPADVFIIFNEPILENWGMAGRQKV